MDKGELGIRRVEGGGRRKEIGGRIVRGNREEGGGLRGEGRWRTEDNEEGLLVRIGRGEGGQNRDDRFIFR